MKYKPLSPGESHSKATVRPRAGIILLSTDLTSERDFYFLRQGANSDFDIYVNRITFSNPISRDSLMAMLDDIPQVLQNIIPGQQLDAVVYHCTSASALLGDQVVIQAIKSVQPKAFVITTAQASVQSILSAGHRKISMLAPYDEAVSRRLADYFITGGLDVLALSYLGLDSDQSIAKLTEEQITKAAIDAMEPEADALFIACTATPVSMILPKLTRAVGKPCFASNHSTFTQLVSALAHC